MEDQYEFRGELRNAGYSQEEAYFNRVNHDLIEKQKRGKTKRTPSDTGNVFEKVTGTFKPARWDEKTYEELGPDSKLSRATVEYVFEGTNFEGKGREEYLLFYRHYNPKDVHQSESAYTGLMHWSGTINGRVGTFVLEEEGIYEGGVAHSMFTILPGSGTDELRGIIGKGKMVATAAETQIEIEFALPEE